MKYCAVLIAVLLGSCTEPPPPPGPPPPPVPIRELAGRFSGRPASCVPIEQIQSIRVSDADPHVLLYGSGRTIWVNRLGACGFNQDDVLVTHPFGSSYCRGDIVRSFDRFSRIPGPACVLNDWVPYNIR